jgi:hypothetical protein
MELDNNTIFSQEEVEAFVANQFGYKGFTITQISNRHYKNRVLPKGKQLIDVQIGYVQPPKKAGGTSKIRNIQNLTLVLDIH